MDNSPTIVQLTFGIEDPDLDDRHRQEWGRRLLPQLQRLDVVEEATQAQGEDSPDGRAGFTLLVGFLTAKVSFDNLKDFLGWLADRMQDKPIKIKVKVGEQEIELEAASHYELLKAEEYATRLREQMQAPS